MREFAQELVDQVIDCWLLAENDLKWTRTCGLVCRDWLPRSRYHLFAEVSLSAKSLPTFVDLVDASSLPLLSFIRQLELRADPQNSGEPLDSSHLARTHQCPNLTAIKIFFDPGFLPVEDTSAADIEFFYAHIRSWAANSVSISRFCLEATRAPLHAVIGLISCLTLPSLKILELDVWILTPSDDTTPLLNLDLHTLNLKVGRNGYLFLSWLLSLPVIPCPKSLTFYGRMSGDHTLMMRYFELAGPKFESLAWTVFGEWREIFAVWRATVPYMMRLHTLTVHSPTASIILDILSLLPTSHGHTARTFVTDPGRMPWPALDKAVADPRLHTLGRLCSKTIIPPLLESSVPLASAPILLLLPWGYERARRVLRIIGVHSLLDQD
ncbi:hypothetical protein B0H19DRAFT_543061 [Mycena capillaripes]|nr:hypothetical protein B0H19DRAFT_543061 [Mycena capillaripes]